MLKNKKILIAFLCGIFLLMLFCNLCTEEVADDWSYHFSWSSGERIDSISDIIPSMKVHYEQTNGRLVAHSFVQIFEALPKVIFNFVNAGMFMLMLGLMYYISYGKKHNFLLLGALFSAVWVFTPAFGQVFLWLDGACNYLWSVCFGLLYILPFVTDFLYDKTIKALWLKILFIPFSLLMGAFSENGSAAFIGMGILLQLALWFFQKKRFTVWGVLSVPTAIIGLYFMVSAPGTHKNKSLSLTATKLRENFITALNMYKLLEVLLVVFCVFLVIAILTKIPREKLILSLIFIAGSLAANFIMITAAYYEGRSMVCSVILLIIADGILMQHLFHADHKAVAASAASIAMLYAAFYICIGVNDIYVTGSKYRQNEQYVIDCKEQGITNIELPMIRCETKYSAGRGLLYLSTESPSNWPNRDMAKYYGVDSIIGVWKNP